jgi:hypothetical protein
MAARVSQRGRMCCMSAVIPPGQPGHGRDQGAHVRPVSASLAEHDAQRGDDYYDGPHEIICNACENNDQTDKGYRGPYATRELAHEALRQHMGWSR